MPEIQFSNKRCRKFLNKRHTIFVRVKLEGQTPILPLLLQARESTFATPY